MSEQPHERSGPDARARRVPHLRFRDPPLRPWREEARARALEIEALSAWVDQLPKDARGEQREEADKRLAESIQKHVKEVELAARGRESRMRTAARLARATSHVHAAEVDLLRRAPRTYVKGELPNLEAHVRRHLPADDPRRVRVEDLARPDNLKDPAWYLSETDRESLIAAVRVASSAAAREQQRVRSYSRIIWAASGLMLAIAVLVAVVGFRAPEFIALCFQPQQDDLLVCPTRESPLPVDANGNDLRDVDEVIAETVRPWDVPLIEFIGMVAAGVTGAIALRRIRGSSTPFAIPVALQGRVKVVEQTSELRRCRRGRAAARSQHGRAIRRIEPPGHADLGGGPVLTLQAGSRREGSGASLGPVSTILAGQTGHLRL